MKSVKYFVFAALLLLATFVPFNSFAAESVSTTEFGTFSYDLVKEICDRCSDVRISGYTNITIPKSSTTVMITAELQDSATGRTITTYSDAKPGGTRAYIGFTWKGETIPQYSVFSCHEARGNDNIARYLKVTF